MANENENQQGEPDQGFRWQGYVGKEITLNFRDSSHSGVMGAPNFKGRYIDLKPCVMYEFDGETAYLSQQPLRISFDLIQGDRVTILAHKEGYLEARVKVANELVAKRKQNKLGFNPSS